MVSLPPLPLIPLPFPLVSALVITLSSALIQTLHSLLFVHSVSSSGRRIDWAKKKDDKRWREPAGGVWGRVSCFSCHIPAKLLYCWSRSSQGGESWQFEIKGRWLGGREEVGGVVRLNGKWEELSGEGKDQAGPFSAAIFLLHTAVQRVISTAPAWCMGAKRLHHPQSSCHEFKDLFCQAGSKGKNRGSQV